GLTEGKSCLTCGTVLVAQVTIAASGHSEVVIPAVAPTCTATGLSEGKKCSTCGTVLVAQVTVAASGHSEVVIPGVAATLTSTGLTEGKKCSTCGTVTVQQVEIPKLQDPNAWNGSIANGFAGGSGTEADPYLISNGAQLAFLAQQINSGSKVKYYRMHYRLTKDIDLGGREWDPIGGFYNEYNTGSTALSFMGVFDGDGHVVSNFKITTPASRHYRYFGLFGRVQGTIQDLGVEDFYIELNHSTAMNVGGLVGDMENAKVLRCYAAGANISVRLSVGNLGTNVGGLVGGGSLSVLTDSYASVYVSSTANENGAYTKAGGLIGTTNNTVEVKNCYASGTVSIMANSLAYAGGLMGGGGSTDMKSVYSVAFGNVSAVCGVKNNEKAGGLSVSQYVNGGYRYNGQNVGGNSITTVGTVCTAGQLNSASFYTDLGWDSSIWDFSDLDVFSGKYPKLKAFQ
ncbi:MAG: hypothetical protein J6B77_06565, partial [Clostridia bacterium]|nr:hypothetical protein [Clostridia bacterium]